MSRDAPIFFVHNNRAKLFYSQLVRTRKYVNTTIYYILVSYCLYLKHFFF